MGNRKIEVGMIGITAIALVGKILLSHPDDTKQTVRDTVEIVSDGATAAKDKALNAVSSGSTVTTAPAAVASSG